MNKRTPRPPLPSAPPGPQRLKNKINRRRFNDDRLQDHFQYHRNTRVTWWYVIDFHFFYYYYYYWNSPVVNNWLPACTSLPSGSCLFSGTVDTSSTVEVFLHKPETLIKTDAGLSPPTWMVFLVGFRRSRWDKQCVFQRVLEMNTWSRAK